jgi:hypothetical protein
MFLHLLELGTAHLGIPESLLRCLVVEAVLALHTMTMLEVEAVELALEAGLELKLLELL